jgi:[ribosomal protein S18]-alanine N-acetyltransferase
LQVSVAPTRTRVRRFRPADLDGVMEIERASFGRWAYSAGLMMAYYRRSPDLFLVASAGPELAGYSVANRKTSSTELVSIAVAPAHRKGGLGRRLLNATVRRLRREGEKRLTLMVKENNRAARRFYENYGFRRVRTVKEYYEDGRDGVLMTLPLPAAWL